MRKEQLLPLGKTRRSFVSKHPSLQVWELVTFLIPLGLILSLVLAHESLCWSWECHSAVDWWRERDQSCLVFIFLRKREHRQQTGAVGMMVDVSIQAGSQVEPPLPSESSKRSSWDPFQDGWPQTCLPCLYWPQQTFAAHLYGPGISMQKNDQDLLAVCYMRIPLEGISVFKKGRELSLGTQSAGTLTLAFWASRNWEINVYCLSYGMCYRSLSRPIPNWSAGPKPNSGKPWGLFPLPAAFCQQVK